jgi:hypothetical protein
MAVTACRDPGSLICCAPGSQTGGGDGVVVFIGPPEAGGRRVRCRRQDRRGGRRAIPGGRILCIATSPTAPEPLTIPPRAWILRGSMLRLLAALLPTLLSALRSRRDSSSRTWPSAKHSPPWPGGGTPTSGPWTGPSGSCCADFGATGPKPSPSSGRTRSCAGTAPGPASTGTICPGAERAPAAPCLARSERSSGRWHPRTLGARPASTGNCFASASMPPSAASPDT